MIQLTILTAAFTDQRTLLMRVIRSDLRQRHWADCPLCATQGMRVSLRNMRVRSVVSMRFLVWDIVHAWRDEHNTTTNGHCIQGMRYASLAECIAGYV